MVEKTEKKIKTPDFPRVHSFIYGITDPDGFGENIQITKHTDWMVTVSYFGAEADELVGAVASFRGLDMYHGAAAALRKILEKFLPPSSILAINVLLASYPSPTDYELEFIMKEAKKNAKGDPDKCLRNFKELIVKEVLHKDVIEGILEKTYGSIILDSKNDKGRVIGQKKKRRITIHFEIDSLVRIQGKDYAIEGKMYSVPPDKPEESLRRYLTSDKLREYLLRRGSLYILIGFSFVYNEKIIRDPSSRQFWREYSAGEYKKRSLTTEDWIRYLRDCPLPADPKLLGTDGVWAVHFTVIDSGIFTENGKIPHELKNATSLPPPPSKLSRMIIKAVGKHREKFKQYVLLRIAEHRRKLIKEGRPLPDLKINMCTNFNILKVHKMSGIIYRLERDIENLELNIKQIKKEKLRLEVGRLREKAGRLREKAGRLEAEAGRLEAEARLAKIEGKENICTELLKEAERKKAEAKELEKEADKIVKELEDILSEVDRKLAETEKFIIENVPPY